MSILISFLSPLLTPGRDSEEKRRKQDVEAEREKEKWERKPINIISRHSRNHNLNPPEAHTHTRTYLKKKNGIHQFLPIQTHTHKSVPPVSYQQSNIHHTPSHTHSIPKTAPYLQHHHLLTCVCVAATIPPPSFTTLLR